MAFRVIGDDNGLGKLVYRRTISAVIPFEAAGYADTHVPAGTGVLRELGQKSFGKRAMS